MIYKSIALPGRIIASERFTIQASFNYEKSTSK